MVIPTAHAETDVEEWPLPELRSKVILLVWIRDEGIVRCHHSHVQVDEVAQERRLVGASVARRKTLVGVTFNVPVSEHILGFVLLDAGDFDLLETPLR